MPVDLEPALGSDRVQQNIAWPYGRCALQISGPLASVTVWKRS
ncbi:hypothetical protein [Nonomuraea insulae]|uniref:Uncharacterized protein n=1 Tax=Nonomuraea insulae TaxID=1616787 RepID=A0ABW1CAK6_9ACTN